MNRYVPTLAVLLVVGLTVASTPVAAAENPRIETYVPEPTVSPGHTNQVTVQFLNDADEVGDRVKTARNVKATMREDGTPFSVSSGTHLLGPLADGRPVTDRFAVTVPRDVAPGTYRVPIRLTYEYDHDDSESTTVYATVRVEDRASFSLVDVGSDLSVGDSGTVSVTMRNTGTENATEASVQFQSQTQNVLFGSSPAGSTFVGDWAPNETKTVTIDASAPKAASNGTYAVATTVQYTDVDGIDRTSFPLSAGVHVGPETDRFDLTDIHQSLRVGEEGTLSMTVTNTGDTVRNAVVTLSPPGRNVNPLETEYALGTVEAGASKQVSFPIEISESAEANPRQFSFTVAFEETDGKNKRTSPLDVQATIQPKRDRFTITPVDATMATGSGGTLTVNVTNNGETTVENVNAKIFANDPLSTSDDEAYIESLDPGETATLAFGVSVSGSARAKSYPLSMDVQYDENGDSKLSNTYQIPVTATESGGGGGLPTTTIVGGAIVVVVALGAVVWYRRR